MSSASQDNSPEHVQVEAPKEQPLPERASEQRSDLEASVGLLRDIVIFFAIISYFIGWIYLNEYLKEFGLSLASLSIPPHYIFVFSYPPLLRPFDEPTWTGFFFSFFKMIVLFIFILGCISAYKLPLIARYFRSRKESTERDMTPSTRDRYALVSYPMIMIAFLVIIITSFFMARETAKEHAQAVLDGDGKAIRFVFKAETLTKEIGRRHEMVRDLLDANSRDFECFRLIWQSQETVYVLNRCNEKFPTYSIPVSAFVMLEAYPYSE